MYAIRSYYGINECPGGVKPYGYITLARNGQYEDAMKLHLEDIRNNFV